MRPGGRVELAEDDAQVTSDEVELAAWLKRINDGACRLMAEGAGGEWQVPWYEHPADNTRLRPVTIREPEIR